MSKNSEAVIKWRKRLKEKMVLAMGGSCQCCGYNKCHNALEFHHIDPTQKEFSFGTIRANPRKLSILIEELKKCVMVCSNCHKEIHYGITDIPEISVKLDESVIISENEIRRRIKQQKSITNSIPKYRRKVFISKKDIQDLLDSTFNGDKHALAKYMGVSLTTINKELNYKPDDRRKIFLSSDEIKDLLSSKYGGNKSALARDLGVSETAIRKKIMK